MTKEADTLNQSNVQGVSSGRSTFSTWQLTVLVIIAGMGGMYFYPDRFGRESLVLLLMMIALTLLSMGMLAYCFRNSGSLSFPNLLREHFGNIGARLVLAAAAVYFAAEISCIVVRQTEMTGFFLLEKTPPQVILAVTLLTVSFMITSGIRQIARAAELLFPAIMLPLVFIIGMALYSMNVGELLPLLPNHLRLSAEMFSLDRLACVGSQLGGIAAAAYFAGYYNKSRLTASLLWGSTALSAFCVMILLCCVGVFSVAGTQHLSFPLTELSRIVSVGSVSLNHRFDILYIMIYTGVTVMTAGILLYCCCISLCGVFSVKLHSCFNFILLPIIFTVSYLSMSDDTFISLVSSWGKMIFLFILIPLLFIFTLFKHFYNSPKRRLSD